MQILIIGPSIERSKGGMATVIKDQLANRLLNNNHTFEYVVSHVDGNVAEKVLYAVKSVVYVIANQRRFDIVHIHTAADASFYRKSILLRISKWFSKKTITHIHGYDFDLFYRNSKPLLKRYIKNSLGKSNRILVLSSYWKNFFDEEFSGFPVDILQNSIDVRYYRECISDANTFNQFLFLGRLGERKGVYDLIKAIDIIVNSLGRTDLHFFLAGDGEVDKVNKIIEARSLKAQVTVLGWINDEEKKKILKEVQVVVLPSYYENLPMALIEAMACGKVVISTYAGGIPDLVKHGYNGYLSAAGDVPQLVKHILFVNANPDMMVTIAKNNIRTISQDFNTDKLSARLDDIYQSL